VEQDLFLVPENKEDKWPPNVQRMDTKYQNRRYNINQKDEGTLDDRGRDGGTNFILRIKEKEIHQILHEHDDEKKRLIKANF
jgi:hypothetical protein